jgi:2,3-bisphosphoglycerate-dependent phosphoglycerate mutase
MIRFIVMRHGETEWNASARIQGQLDTKLNERGRLQARALALRLADEPIDELWSSDLDRARQTAAPVAATRGGEVRYDERLRERHFGILQGLTYGEAERQYPVHYHGYMDNVPEEGFASGETLTDFYQRVRDFFLERARASGPGSCVALATHGGVVSCLYRFAQQIPLDAPRTWSMPNAAINEFVVDGDRWRVTRFADVEHLETALDDV